MSGVAPNKNASTGAYVPDRVQCPNGRTIYVDPSDERAKNLVRSGGDLNPPTLAIWKLLLSEFSWTHIVDVGANYGELLVNADLSSSAEVVALEPNPYLLPYLRRTLGELGRPVTLIEEAASAQPGIARLVIDRDWSGMSAIGGLPAGSENHKVEVIQVPTTTLAAVVGSRTIGVAPRVLVKIDVEGHEQGVLEGAMALIEQAERFAALVEILHADDRSLNWLIAHFEIELYDKQTKKLVPVSVTNASELRAEIAAKQYYPQDAVLRPRA
jgi:FkbM family methyltransferase